MTFNISFGKLSLGNGKTKSAIADFCENDTRIIQKLGECCSQIDSETEDDCFVLSAKKDRQGTTFDLSTSYNTSSFYKYSNHETTKDAVIFRKTLPSEQQADEKISFLDSIIKKFQQDKQTGKYYAINLVKKYNDEGVITIKGAANKAEKLAEVINNDSDIAAEVESMLASLSDSLKEDDNTAVLKLAKSKNSMRYSPNSILMSITINSINQPANQINIEQSDTKETRIEKIRQLQQAAVNSMMGLENFKEECPEELKKLFEQFS